MLVVVPTLVHIVCKTMIYLSQIREGGHDVGDGSTYIRRNGAYLDQYPPRKKRKSLSDQDVHFIQHERKKYEIYRYFWSYSHFTLSLSFICVLFCLIYFASPPWYCWAYLRNRGPDENIQSANIAVRNLAFGRLPENSHWSIICGDMDHWLPWCATNMHLPMFWGADKNKNGKWNISVNTYPLRNPKCLLI